MKSRIELNKLYFINILITFALILCVSCSRPIQLIDYYYVYPQDEFGNGYYLMCKLGCKSDSKIEYLQQVKWNNKYVILEQKKPNRGAVWYVIKARTEELLCCNNDKLFGPLSNVEMEKLIKNEDIGKLKIKRF